MQVLCHTYLISSPAQMPFPHLHTTIKPSVLQMLGNYYPSPSVRYVISVRQAGSLSLRLFLFLHYVMTLYQLDGLYSKNMRK
jgi:hypothetical protein